jgi:hypothetical protein
MVSDEDVESKGNPPNSSMLIELREREYREFLFSPVSTKLLLVHAVHHWKGWKQKSLTVLRAATFAPTDHKTAYSRRKLIYLKLTM